MKIRNVLLHTAVASAILAMTGAASAGTLSGSTTFAAELFGTGSSTLALQPTALTYTYSTPGGIVINNGGTLNMYFRLGNGATFAVAPANVNFGGTAVTGLGLTVGAPVRSTTPDTATIVVPLTNNTGGNVTIGVGATLIYTPAVGAVLTGTSAGTITTTASASVAPASVNAPTLPSDVEPVISLNYTTTAEAVTTLVVPSSSFAIPLAPETTRIDLTVAGAPGSRFTNAAPYANANASSTTIVNLGAVRFTETTGVQQTALTGVDYTIAGRATSGTALSGTVTGTFKTGSTAALTTDAACTTPIANGSAGTLNVGLTTFTFAGGTTPTSAANNFVCLTVPTTNATIPVTEPTASFTYAKAATDVADTAAGTLYSLRQNGATAELRNYIPAAVTGYINVARVINTGSIGAQVSVALIDEASGVVGTAVPIGGVLPAGAAMRLTQTQIEAAVGTLSASVRPRLRFTAPTNGMEVQSFANTPNGAYSNISGKE